MKSEIVNLLKNELKLSVKEVENLLEVPPSDEMGDYAFPCFILAKKLRKNPMEIAKGLAEKLRKKGLGKGMEGVDFKGAYVNFFIDKKILAESVLKNAGKIGKKKGEKVMIEFSQANTHKAFHVGHIRGTSLGESLARISEVRGDKVVRANYQGDTGMHVAKWIWCYNKYHKKEALKKDESWIAGIYVDAVSHLAKNEKLQKEVDVINQKLDSREDKELNELWKKTRKLSLDALEVIYGDLNTGFDKYYFEGDVEQEGKNIVADLVKKKIAKVDDGATIVDLKSKGLGVWVLLRSDGTVLYSAKDLVLARQKFKDYNLDKSIYVVADAQNLHMVQLGQTLRLMEFKDESKIRHRAYGLVRLPTGKMSSRTGDNILYSDFKKEIVDFTKKRLADRDGKISGKDLDDRALKIAIASIKYSMLKQDTNKTIVFDKKEALRFEGDTGPYLLYSYARASSIIRRVKSKKAVKIIDLKKEEIKLLKKIDSFGEVVGKAHFYLAPNLIANYCYELASQFNEFYHCCPVLGSIEEGFRLKLVDAFRVTMKKGLELLGIDVLEEM
jgi:arginyl-tRNA synthetase